MPKKDDSPDFSFLNALSGGKDSAILTPETANTNSDAAEDSASELEAPVQDESILETPEVANEAEAAEAEEESGSGSIFDEFQEEQAHSEASDSESVDENRADDLDDDQDIEEEETAQAEPDLEAASTDPTAEHAEEDNPADSTEPQETGFSWMNQSSAPVAAKTTQATPPVENQSGGQPGFSWATVSESAPEKSGENSDSPIGFSAESQPENTEQSEEVAETNAVAPLASGLAESESDSQTYSSATTENEKAIALASSAAELIAGAAVVSAATAGAGSLINLPNSSSTSSSSQPKPSKAAAEEPPKKGLNQAILISYASAITLFCLYLLMQSFTGKPHELESLPDLKPPVNKDGEIAYQLVSESAGLPNGHTLELGKSQRYGSLKVTPLRVEKSPLEFTHYTGDANRKREPTEPVLKLWIKFENVSTDQKFAPIDRQLMLTRIVDSKRPEFLRANQWISPVRDKGKLEKTSLLYNLELSGDWNLAKMDEEPTLGPGESVEVYFPSAEVSTMNLDTPLLWRVHFRKGYNPESYRGVTTLIEVKVDPKSIEST